MNFSLFSLANLKRSSLFGFVSDTSILQIRSYSWKLFWINLNTSYNGSFVGFKGSGRYWSVKHLQNIRRITCGCHFGVYSCAYFSSIGNTTGVPFDKQTLENSCRKVYTLNMEIFLAHPGMVGEMVQNSQS